MVLRATVVFRAVVFFAVVLRATVVFRAVAFRAVLRLAGAFFAVVRLAVVLREVVFFVTRLRGQPLDNSVPCARRQNALLVLGLSPESLDGREN